LRRIHPTANPAVNAQMLSLVNPITAKSISKARNSRVLVLG